MQTVQQLSNLNARGGDTRSSIASFDNDKHLRALVWIMREEQAGFASQGAGIRGNFNLATPTLMRKKLMPFAIVGGWFVTGMEASKRKRCTMQKGQHDGVGWSRIS